MILDTLKNYALGGSMIALIAVSVYAYALRADNKSLSAQTKPLAQAADDATRYAEGYRAAQAECVSEMSRLREENEAAVLAAQLAKAVAEAKAEEYFNRLHNPLPADCDAILNAKVCPSLMDY